ncbi:hypothetical protein [Sphingobium chungbukense]|uniref:Integral membrane protein n=1 Tax=Sphingobium chungbukense TaxID=56193 RepID=A0A0M3AL97_9SPHN|nr:hypothetical protein [Sphingobium chungbukense]KKW90718.1 hypothetical protein YP76_19390 [Sphingobium chungbukense]
MIVAWLLAAHIAVLGYWLGSEFVINSTYRYVSYSDRMPFEERSRLMEHVMHVDQHVRYALVLQASLGPAIAALYGYIPGGEATAIGFGIFGAFWFGFVELVHRLRHSRIGKTLGAIDRTSRYVLMAVLLGVATGLIGGAWDMPQWLRWKLALFACVMMCGVGIRLALIAHFRTWAIMAREGPTDETNAIIKRTYVRATSVLLLLWVFITAITVVSIWKPM